MKLKEAFKNFIISRKDWDNGYNPNRLKDELNITYYLIKNRFVKIERFDDIQEAIEETFDNIIVNNEILTKDNYKEYDLKKISRKYNKSLKSIINNLENNKIILLNYYNKYDLEEVFLIFEAGLDYGGFFGGCSKW